MPANRTRLVLTPLSLFPILVACGLLLAFAGAPRAGTPSGNPVQAVQDPRLAGAYRFEQGGWIYVHLEGEPARIGFAHGYLLAPEIADAFAAVKLQAGHETQRDWDFFRKAAHNMLWPKIDPEYQAELRGIAEGLKARRVALDLDDVVALNAFEELPGYYVPWYNQQHKVAGAPASPAPAIAAPSWPQVAGRVITRWSSPTTTGPATSTASAGASSSTLFPSAATASSWTASPASSSATTTSA